MTAEMAEMAAITAAEPVVLDVYKQETVNAEKAVFVPQTRIAFATAMVVSLHAGMVPVQSVPRN